MTDLTEQWKKGELPEGWYWVKNVTWSECINMLYNWSDTFLDGDVPVDNDKIIEVLAPVPSYEEYLSLTYAKEEDEKIIAEYEAENKRLKHDVGNLGYKIKNQRKEIERQIAQNAQLKEQINKCYLDAINRGTANTVKAVKEFGMPERIKELVEQNAHLKELLKECELWFTGMVGNMNDKNVGEHNKSVPIGNFEYIFKEFSQKIKEVLK